MSNILYICEHANECNSNSMCSHRIPHAYIELCEHGECTIGSYKCIQYILNEWDCDNNE